MGVKDEDSDTFLFCICGLVSSSILGKILQTSCASIHSDLCVPHVCEVECMRERECVCTSI